MLNKTVDYDNDNDEFLTNNNLNNTYSYIKNII